MRTLSRGSSTSAISHDDYYYFHENQLALIGERTAKIFRIGDEVKIRVANVDMQEYKVDFELVEMKKSDGKPKRVRVIDNKSGTGGGNGRRNAKSKAKVKSKASTGDAKIIRFNDKGEPEKNQKQNGQAGSGRTEAKTEKGGFWRGAPKKKKKPAARKRPRK